MVGTTAEIIACSHSNNGYKVKAVGRQRFKVLRIVSELIKYIIISIIYNNFKESVKFFLKANFIFQ